MNLDLSNMEEMRKLIKMKKENPLGYEEFMKSFKEVGGEQI